jgi:Ser/Thr protein kinase RdoA (MazF antagonist)
MEITYANDIKSAREIFNLPSENVTLDKLVSVNNELYLLTSKDGSYVIKIYKTDDYHKIQREVLLFESVNTDIAYYVSVNGNKVERIKNKYVTCQPYLHNEMKNLDYSKFGYMVGKYHKKLAKLPESSIYNFDLQHHINYAQLWNLYIQKNNETMAEHKEYEYFSEYISKVLEFDKSKFNRSYIQLIHGDCHTGNIISSQGKLILIDWECTVLKPTLCEISYFIISSIFVYEEKECWRKCITDFLRGYNEVCPIEERDIRNFPNYVLLDRLLDLKVYEKNFLESCTKFNKYLVNDLKAIKWLEENWVYILKDWEWEKC